MCTGETAEEGTVGATALATWQGREHGGASRLKRGPCCMLGGRFTVDDWRWLQKAIVGSLAA